MFDLLTKPILNAVDVVMDTGDMMIGGEGPSREQVAELISTGLTVAAIAEVYGTTVGVIEGLIE